MIATAFAVLALLGPGAGVSAPSDGYYSSPRVFCAGQLLRGHWNRVHDRIYWRTGSGRVTFDGVTFSNRSRAVVTVAAQFETFGDE